MVKRSILIAVFGVGMAVIFGTEAKAGCIDLGGGALYCAEWIPGSEICKLTTTGGIALPKNSSARCEVDEPDVEAGLTGTLVCTQPTGGAGITLATASTNTKTKCKDHQFSGTGTGHDSHDDHCSVTTGFNVTAGDVNFPLFTQTGPGGLNCNSRGVCKTLLEVDIPQANGDEICAEQNGFGSKFVSFTVTDQFLARAIICDGGSFGEECTGTQRTIEELCELSENGTTYVCVPLTEGPS